MDRLRDVRDVRDEALRILALLASFSSAQAQWAKDILGHSKLFVRIQNSGDKRGAGDFVFDLRGAAKAVAPVLGACGW